VSGKQDAAGYLLARLYASSMLGSLLGTQMQRRSSSFKAFLYTPRVRNGNKSYLEGMNLNTVDARNLNTNVPLSQKHRQWLGGTKVALTLPANEVVSEPVRFGPQLQALAQKPCVVRHCGLPFCQRFSIGASNVILFWNKPVRHVVGRSPHPFPFYAHMEATRKGLVS
jgi:hypothetical protein